MLLDQKNSEEANGGDDDLTTGNSKEQAPSTPKWSDEIKPRPIKIPPKESNNDPFLRKLRKLKEIGKEAALSEPFESTPLLAQTLESRIEEGSAMLDELIETGEAPKTSAGGGSSTGWNSLKMHMSKGDFLLGVESVHGDEKRIGRRRDSLRRRKFEEFHSGMHFSKSQILLAIVLYLVVSIGLFSFYLEPQWTVIDSCYFAVSTFTTLGPGDIVPTHTVSIIFTCVYALGGVACLGFTLGMLGHDLLDRQEKLVRDTEAVYEQDLMTLFDTLAVTSGHGKSSFETPRKLKERLKMESRVRLWRFLMLLVIILVLAYFIGSSSGWGMLSTVYYFIITGEWCLPSFFSFLYIINLKTLIGCTIGYGDLSPSSQEERFLAVIFIPLACVVTGHWLGFIANTIIERQCAQFRSQYESRELTKDDLDVMDVNCSGKVTRAEFLEFMLVAMNKIDHDLVDELHDYFNRLDVRGDGELSRDDLVEAARRKLKHPRRKLELATYKRRLLDQAAVQQSRPNIFSLSFFGQNKSDPGQIMIRKTFSSFLSGDSSGSDDEMQPNSRHSML